MLHAATESRNLSPASAVGDTSRASRCVACFAHPYLVRRRRRRRAASSPFSARGVESHVGHLARAVAAEACRPRAVAAPEPALPRRPLPSCAHAEESHAVVTWKLTSGMRRACGGPCNGDHRRPPKVVQPRCTAEESHGDGPCRPGEGASRGSSREVRRAANMVTWPCVDQFALAFLAWYTWFSYGKTEIGLTTVVRLENREWSYFLSVLRRYVALSWHTNNY